MKAWFWRIIASSIFVLGVAVITRILIPPVPSHVVMVAGLQGTSLYTLAQRYRERLNSLGVKIELKETLGTPESLRALADDTAGVNIAFVTGGVSEGIKPPNAESLGLISTSGFWVFYRGSETLREMRQLKGKRIAVGTVGSLSKALADRVLPQFGITNETAKILPIPASQTFEAWRRGEIDIVWAVAVPEGTLIPRLLADPDARIMSFPSIDAFVRRNPDLLKVNLPRGLIDLEKGIPSEDITMLGTPVRIMVRRDLHPEIVAALLDVMTIESSGQGTFHNAKEYPNGNDREFTMAETAIDYYKNGPSFLRRHLPAGWSTYFTRVLAIVAAMLAIVIPIFNYGPRLYRWVIRQKLVGVYSTLRGIDSALQSKLTIEEARDLQRKLESLEKEVAVLMIPYRQSDLHFGFKVHVNLVRTRLATKLAELRSA